MKFSLNDFICISPSSTKYSLALSESFPSPISVLLPMLFKLPKFHSSYTSKLLGSSDCYVTSLNLFDPLDVQPTDKSPITTFLPSQCHFMWMENFLRRNLTIYFYVILLAIQTLLMLWPKSHLQIFFKKIKVTFPSIKWLPTCCVDLLVGPGR